MCRQILVSVVISDSVEFVQPFSNFLHERLADRQLLIEVHSAVSEVRPTRRTMTETIFCVCSYA